MPVPVETIIEIFRRTSEQLMEVLKEKGLGNIDGEQFERDHKERIEAFGKLVRDIEK